MAVNQALVFKEWVPEGLPVAGKSFVLEDVAEPPSPSAGEVTAKLRVVSVDPYLRGRMKDRLSYFPGFTIDQPGGFLIFSLCFELTCEQATASLCWRSLNPRTKNSNQGISSQVLSLLKYSCFSNQLM